MAATIAFGAVAALWSVALPLAEGPDEPAHFGLVLHLASGEGYPEFDGLFHTVGVSSRGRFCSQYAGAVRVCPGFDEEVTATAVRRHLAADAPPRATRPDWNDDGGDVATGAFNQMPQHPPLYYWTMAGVLRAGRVVNGGPASMDRELALLRLVNVLVVLPLPILAWLTARRVGLGQWPAQAACVSMVGIPMLTSIGSTLNNDNLLTLLGAVLLALLAAVMAGNRSRSLALTVGLVLVLALLTKAFAVVFGPVIVLAYLLGRDRDAQRPLRSVVEPIGWVAAVTIGPVVGWFGRAQIRTGSFSPSVDARRYTEALRPPGFEPDPLHFIDRFVALLSERTWGSFGWYSVRIPGWATVGLTLVSAVLLALGLLTSRRMREPSWLQRALVLMGPSLLVGGLVLVRAWSLHARSGQYPFIQGRYLFAGVTGVVVVGACGLDRLRSVISGRGGGGRAAMVGLAVGVVAMQVLTLQLVMRGFWAARVASPTARLEAMAAWSGWPRAVVYTIAITAILSLVNLVVAALALRSEAP